MKALLALTAFIAVAANASPLTVAASYRNDKVVNNEGVEVSAQYNTNSLAFGANIMANENKVLSYGATVGVPTKLVGIQVTPFMGVEQYRTSKEFTAVNLGTKVVVPVYKTLGLTTDVKWVQGTGSKNDLSDVSYSVGIANKF